MPKKIRELIQDLKKAGFSDRGGKGSHRNFSHPCGGRITISGTLGSDAKRYQEKAVENIIREGEWMKLSNRYLKVVEWSDEDQCYVGTCPGLMSGGIHGDDEAKVYRELCQAVDEWIDIVQRDGTPLPAATAGKDYSGKFVLRVGKDLHKTLAVNALRKGESLNSYCTMLLREQSVPYAARHELNNR